MANNLLHFVDLTVDKLIKLNEKQKNLIQKLNDNIANLDLNNLTWENCIESPIREESKYSLEFSLSDFEQLHPDKMIRDISSELNKQMGAFAIEQSTREDVYRVISHYYNNQYLHEKENLTPEQHKYIKNVMIGYNMAGMGLDDKKKEQVIEINKRLSVLSSDYMKNISEVNSEFEFELGDLKGLDETWLSNRFDERTLKYKVKLTYPDYIPVMEYCVVRETRKFMAEAMGSRCMDTNMSIILEAINLRKKKAELFGFESHADFKLQNMMSKNSHNVMNFYSKLMEKIVPLVNSDKEKLIALSKEMDGITELQSYDKSYYSRIYTEKVSGLNMSDLQKMFTIDSVTNGIFSIYQELLGLKFVDITDSNSQALYAEKVRLFCVYDSTDLLDANPIAYFYLDLYPREGKYSHAAMFTFVRGSQYNLPISAIVCNFDPNSNVEFDNVVTYFHEFGHLMHNCVSTVKIESLSGTACQRDFVETPSQMFEEWCYCMEPLKRLVQPEYLNDITDELISKINFQQKIMQGIFNATQIMYGLLDQSIHSNSIPTNTWEYTNELSIRLLGWGLLPNSNMLANWGHMFGYDALYYGYLWSKVYAIDLFSYFKQNPLDKKLGLRLREKILSKGGSYDAMELLVDFMEREPNPNAYIEFLSE